MAGASILCVAVLQPVHHTVFHWWRLVLSLLPCSPPCCSLSCRLLEEAAHVAPAPHNLHVCFVSRYSLTCVCCLLLFILQATAGGSVSAPFSSQPACVCYASMLPDLYVLPFAAVHPAGYYRRQCFRTPLITTYMRLLCPNAA
jgi:hypothetical protein